MKNYSSKPCNKTRTRFRTPSRLRMKKVLTRNRTITNETCHSKKHSYINYSIFEGKRGGDK